MTKTFSILLALSLLLLTSCSDKPTSHMPIVIGDKSSIVTETDSLYLANKTADISVQNKKSSEGKIASMMTQVDSMKASQKLNNDEHALAPLTGFTIHFAQCDVILDGVSAHAIQNTQDERKSNSVSYVKDIGDLNELKIQVQGLSEVKIEQRFYTKLSVEKADEIYQLNDLGKYISDWHTLVGKSNLFISLGTNSTQFFSVDNSKIKNALDRELRKKNKSRQDIQTWMEAIKNTNSYADAPCKTNLVSSQWRIIGKQNGKRIQKLIQLDITN